MLADVKRGWKWVRHTVEILLRLDGRLTHLHERMSALTTVVGRLNDELRRNLEQGDPVSVYLLGRYLHNELLADERGDLIPPKERWTITAKTCWLERGHHTAVSFSSQRKLEPGALVFVAGPAFLTNLTLGHDSQVVFSRSLGVLGCIGPEVNLGMNITAYIESVAPGTLRAMSE